MHGGGGGVWYQPSSSSSVKEERVKGEMPVMQFCWFNNYSNTVNERVSIFCVRALVHTLEMSESEGVSVSQRGGEVSWQLYKKEMHKN